MGTRIKKSVKTFSVERSLDFFCISITYCSNCICKYNATLQEVCIFVCFQLIRCKIIIRQTSDTLYSLHIPDTLEFQVVNGHNCLDSPEKFVLLERIVKINRYKTCLPVMTVNNVRSESDHRKYGKYSLGEKCEFLQIPWCTVIWFWSAEIIFIINKVELYSVILHMHNSNIAVLVSQIHVKMGNILHFVLPFLFHTGIFRKDHTNIKITFIETFRECSGYIGQTACFNKWYCFGCCK